LREVAFPQHPHKAEPYTSFASDTPKRGYGYKRKALLQSMLLYDECWTLFKNSNGALAFLLP